MILKNKNTIVGVRRTDTPTRTMTFASASQYLTFRNEFVTAPSVTDQFAEWFRELIDEYEDEHLCHLNRQYILSTKRTNTGNIHGESFLFFYDSRVAELVRKSRFTLTCLDCDYDFMIENGLILDGDVVEDCEICFAPILVPRFFINHEEREVDPDRMTLILYGRMTVHLDDESYVDEDNNFHWSKMGKDAPLVPLDGKIATLSPDQKTVFYDQHSWITEQDIRKILDPLAFGSYTVQMCPWTSSPMGSRRFVNIVFAAKNNNAFYVENVLRRVWIGEKKNIFVAFSMSFKQQARPQHQSHTSGSASYRPQPPASTSQQGVCPFFARGTCKFGDKCHNLHVQKPKPLVQPVQVDASGFTMVPTKQRKDSVSGSQGQYRR